MVEKTTNINNITDTKLTIEERVSTYEGPNHLAKAENIVSNTILEDVNTAVK